MTEQLFQLLKKKIPTQRKTREIGNAAEQIALDYLIKHGLKLVQKQFRCPFGEWDLIMREHNTIVFVEVRYKKNTHFCDPIETIDYRKQKKLIRSAEFYLLKHPNTECRLDVIGISGIPPKIKIDWIQDAFGVQ